MIEDMLRLMAVPAPDAVARFDVVERRIALYRADRPLTLAMRGNRAELFETAVRGVELAGLWELLEIAEGYRYLTRHAHLSDCGVTRARLATVWPDKRRAKIARTLAQSPVWGTPAGER